MYQLKDGIKNTKCCELKEMEFGGHFSQCLGLHFMKRKRQNHDALRESSRL